MKTLATLLFAVLLSALPFSAHADSLGVMRTSLINGDVQIKIPDTGDWAPLAVNTPIVEGDEIWVPEGGRAELQLNTDTYVRLDENTALGIVRMEQRSPQFYLFQGRAYVYYNDVRNGVIQVDTPSVSVRASDSAVFRIDVPDEYTDVSVYKGTVFAENEFGRTRVSDDMMLSLGPQTEGELGPLGPPDEWETWNKERNRRVFARQDSDRYLPDELRPFAHDFDTGGRWLYLAEYGWSWTPTVHAGPDWAPYRQGRWMWVNDDYVWVSYEPWGWAPYHYGRWVFARDVWYWVPPAAGEAYWAPGYVGWVYSGDVVAWVPLAPGDIYYGRGYYGPNSVNIINLNINQVNVTHVYRNAHFVNAITAVNTGAFLSGHYTSRVNPSVIAHVRNDMFLARKIVPGRPPIKPTLEARIPIRKSIAPAKLPPSTIRNLQIREVQRARPLVTDPQKSVFRPSAVPKQLEIRKVPTGRSLPERVKERQHLQTVPRRTPVPVPGTAPAPAPALKRPEERLPMPGTTPGRTSEKLPIPDKRQAPVMTEPGKQAPPAVTPRPAPANPLEKRMERKFERPATATPAPEKRLEAPAGSPAPERRLERPLKPGVSGEKGSGLIRQDPATRPVKPEQKDQEKAKPKAEPNKEDLKNRFPGLKKPDEPK